MKYIGNDEICLVIKQKMFIGEIQIVYFKEPDRELEKGDINNREYEAELSIPASERTIYYYYYYYYCCCCYYLGAARKLFAKIRGLRI